MKSPSRNLELLLNQTAAALLATAVCELFPKVLLIRGEGSPAYFFYDFVFPNAFQESSLSVIEERMRVIIKEKRPVRTLEMMPGNAATMMRHRGQVIAAEMINDLDRATVEMAQIGDFHVYCPYPILDELSIPHIKILEGYLLGDNTVRIVGAASSEKDVLKKRAKQALPSTQSHLALVKEMGLCAPSKEEGLWYWLPKGEALKHQMIAWWRTLHVNENFNLISTPQAFTEEEGMRRSHRHYLKTFGVEKVAEISWMDTGIASDPADGLLSLRAATCDRAHLVYPDEKLLEECISSLHFIHNIPKILGFEFEIVLSVSSEGSKKARSKGAAIFRQALEKSGLEYTEEKEYRHNELASIEVRIADALGRRWRGPFLSIAEDNLLIRSVFGSLERIVALLVEKTGGVLPLFLAPQQVRILALSERTLSYANAVLESLKEKGIRAEIECSEEKLKTRLFNAFQEKVPFVVLLGEREEKGNMLTVRRCGENEERSTTLEELCKKLKDEIGSGNSELTN